MSSRVSRDDIEQMQRLYSDGMSVNRISTETGWAPRTVQNHLWPITETEIFVKEPVSAHTIAIRKRIRQIMGERNECSNKPRKRRVKTKVIPADQIPHGYIW